MSRLLTRRSALMLGAACLAAPQAFAAGRLSFPLRLAYARIAPSGFVHIRSQEQDAWTLLQVRTGGLIDSIEPIQPSSMLGQHAPEIDGGASCVLAARTLADGKGFDHVILYATADGQPDRKPANGWIERCFASLGSLAAGEQRAFGEAHLLDVAGGDPLISAMADAPPRSLLNPFDNHRRPERETLTLLTLNLERRLQQMSRPAFDAQRSIAD